MTYLKEYGVIMHVDGRIRLYRPDCVKEVALKEIPDYDWRKGRRKNQSHKVGRWKIISVTLKYTVVADDGRTLVFSGWDYCGHKYRKLDIGKRIKFFKHPRDIRPYRFLLTGE